MAYKSKKESTIEFDFKWESLSCNTIMKYNAKKLGSKFSKFDNMADLYLFKLSSTETKISTISCGWLYL